jgi:spore coat polysaccharide biosynthesis protein SpsF
MGIDIALVIQARMSSLRFPEKALTPLCGIPMLMWTINYCREINLPLFVLTSTDKSDDQLVDMLEKNNVSYYRGSLENVISRYLSFMRELQVKKVVRISGDSPLINPDIMLKVIAQDLESTDAYLITNIFPRSFPKGQSVEVIPRKSLELLWDRNLSKPDIEHVTSYFYANSKEFKIINLNNIEDLSTINLSVDTKEDLLRVSQFITHTSLNYSSPALSWKNFSKAIIESRIFQ